MGAGSGRFRSTGILMAGGIFCGLYHLEEGHLGHLRHGGFGPGRLRVLRLFLRSRLGVRESLLDALDNGGDLPSNRLYGFPSFSLKTLGLLLGNLHALLDI